jgi:type IV secretory pathway ATPase VirB11/archaellum biosynthesis ATPase
MTRARNPLSALIALLYFLMSTPQLWAQRCGVERWSVKTGTDADAERVDLANPKNKTIAELIALTPPHPIPADSRFSPTETTVFVVNATLTDYKLEGGSKGDSDYHLVLQDDQGNTMVAEIPSPHCVDSGSPFAAQIANARVKFDSQLTAGSSFQTADIPVQVTGVGFFDFAHGQHGAAPNVFELHPILDIVFNPQPMGGPDFSLSVPSSAIHAAQGGSTSLTIGVNSVQGPLPNVALSTSGLPTGVKSHLSPLSNGKSTLTLTVSAATPNGSFPFVITGTGGGKTSLLNSLAQLIPEDERLLLIEDTAEIQISHLNLVRLEARPAQNGVPAVGIRDLLKAALRHRPDRILLGEVRGGEAFDLLQLLNTGHAGTISTIHANSARQGLSRFTSCVLQSGVELPYRAIKSNIADSLNVVVQIERRPGRRLVSEVIEIKGYNPDADLFDYCSMYQKA